MSGSYCNDERTEYDDRYATVASVYDEFLIAADAAADDPNDSNKWIAFDNEKQRVDDELQALIDKFADVVTCYEGHKP